MYGIEVIPFRITLKLNSFVSIKKTGPRNLSLKLEKNFSAFYHNFIKSFRWRNIFVLPYFCGYNVVSPVFVCVRYFLKCYVV